MRQPSPSQAHAPPSAPAAPTATELVTRPDPGLARGAWEAPVWVFWVALALVLISAAAYALRRFGILRFGDLGKKRVDVPPPSSRIGRS
jgi:hypothetical protein